jgi:hypothetical protein
LRSYSLLEELIQSQKEGFLNIVGSFLTISTALLSVFTYIQNPQVGSSIWYVLFFIVVIIVVSWFLLRYRLRTTEILQQGTLFGILLDELLKYKTQITMIQNYGDTTTDFGKYFLIHTIDLLKASNKQVLAIKERLEKRDKYDSTLEAIGWDKNRAAKLFKEVEEVIGYESQAQAKAQGQEEVVKPNIEKRSE